jgi:hypothetical protein
MALPTVINPSASHTQSGEDSTFSERTTAIRFSLPLFRVKRAPMSPRDERKQSNLGAIWVADSDDHIAANVRRH